MPDETSFKIENPSQLPAYVYSGYPDNDPFNTEVKRGGPYFETLREAGFRVTRVSPGSKEILMPTYPWVFAFLPVPLTDAVESIKNLAAGNCSVILDCHFPIMQLERVQSPDDEVIFSVIENREIMLANLAAACAVTVSQAPWAADLAAVNPRVWYLPDIEDEDDEASVVQFAAKFMEIAVATHRQCRTGSIEEVS